MFKTVEEVKELLAKRYKKVWAEEAAGCCCEAWPLRLPVGSCTKKELEDHFVEACSGADALRALADSLGLGVECTTRLVGGSKQTFPTHLVVANMGGACGGDEKHASVCRCAPAHRSLVSRLSTAGGR